MDQVEGAKHSRRRAGLPQEVAEAELVEPVQVRVAARVARIDARDDLLKRRLDGLVGGDVGLGEPRGPGADVDGTREPGGDPPGSATYDGTSVSPSSVTSPR